MTKIMMPPMVSAAVFFIVGWLVGWLSPTSGQNTYFEANDISNFFLRNPDMIGEQVGLKEIVGGEWDFVCAAGPGISTSGFLDAIFGEESWRIVSGRTIDEGLLDYLYKLALVSSQNDVYLMNFDESLFQIGGTLPDCEDQASIENIVLTFEETMISNDPDGLGEFFTSIKFEEVGK